MGFKAVELLIAGKTNRLVVMQNGKVTDVDIDEGLQAKKEISPEMVKLCKVLSW